MMQAKSAKRKRKQLHRLIPILLALVILIAGGVAFALLSREAEIVPVSSLRFSMLQDVKRMDLVQEVNRGELLDAEALIRPEKEGTVQVLLQAENALGKISQIRLDVIFYYPEEALPAIDAAPSVTVWEDAEIDFSQYATATASDGTPLAVSVKGDTETETVGERTAYFTATDARGCSRTVPFVFKVLPSPFDETGKPKDGTYLTPTGHTLVIKDGVTLADGHLLLNKSFSVPKDYLGGHRYLTEETENAYYAVRQAAREDGITITLKSGTRNWADQNYIFNNYVKNDSLENALTYSARPGHSEHQSGLAMDLVTSSTAASQEPENKRALEWLNKNAYRYGLILRYPEGKSDIHGYIFEPWHYRYVGVELAEILYNGGDWITMEEYFGVPSVYLAY